MRRSREGAWIEIFCLSYTDVKYDVAPARERGLKWQRVPLGVLLQTSLPRGSVD